MANKVWYSKTTLTGGGATALDGINHSNLVNGDIAYVWVSGTLYTYKYNSGSSASESSPTIIAPDSGTGRWELQSPYSLSVAQIAYASTTALVSGSTTLPIDDTIPQNSEGFEIITCAVTPVSATNILFIIANLGSVSCAGSQFGMALFQDSTAGALAAVCSHTNIFTPMTLTHMMVAGTASATTFKIRFGTNGAGTNYVNAVPAATGRVFGGVSSTTLTIVEVVP